MRKITLSFCLLVTMPAITFARGWRGIVPLHSTCTDVKRLLGLTACDNSPHRLNDETVTIIFSEKPCLEGWNVPTGTVMTVDVHPKPGLRLADLQIDEDNYKKTADEHVKGVFYYTNSKEGISITVFPDGTVGNFLYGPATDDINLRYPRSLANLPPRDGKPDGSVKFDEYGNLSVKEEARRLNDFAIQLEAQPTTQAYIIAYGGKRSRIGEAKNRAARAKDYLMKVGIDRARVVIIDGGYRDESTTDLFIRLKGGAAPTPSPTLCPSEVRIIKNPATNKRGRARPSR